MTDVLSPTVPSEPTTPLGVGGDPSTDFTDLTEVIRREVAKALAAEKLNNVLVGWITSLEPVTVRKLDGEDIQPVLKNTDVILQVGQKVGLTHTVNGYVIDNFVHPVNTETSETIPSHNHDAFYSLTGHSHPPDTSVTNKYGRFHLGTNQSIPTGTTNTQVDMDQTNSSTMGNTSGAGALTLPDTGMYLFGTTICWDSNAVGFRRVDIVRDGTTIATDTVQNVAGGQATVQSASILVESVAGDVITIGVQQTSGGSLAIHATDGYAGRLSSRLWVIYFGLEN